MALIQATCTAHDSKAAAHTVEESVGQHAVPPQSHYSTTTTPGKFLHVMLHLSNSSCAYQQGLSAP